mmetsp:Transcript_24857/g.51028  ORF Transcript_24857/g.51028 Transcript_24857/m.51028 type:complete len:330 (-) Transcript_24857:148-1137(-)
MLKPLFTAAAAVLVVSADTTADTSATPSLETAPSFNMPPFASVALFTASCSKTPTWEPTWELSPTPSLGASACAKPSPSTSSPMSRQLPSAKLSSVFIFLRAASPSPTSLLSSLSLPLSSSASFGFFSATIKTLSSSPSPSSAAGASSASEPSASEPSPRFSASGFNASGGVRERRDDADVANRLLNPSSLSSSLPSLSSSPPSPLLMEKVAEVPTLAFASVGIPAAAVGMAVDDVEDDAEAEVVAAAGAEDLLLRAPPLPPKLVSLPNDEEGDKDDGGGGGFLVTSAAADTDFALSPGLPVSGTTTCGRRERPLKRLRHAMLQKRPLP